jgi:hypothetical protein
VALSARRVGTENRLHFRSALLLRCRACAEAEVEAVTTKLLAPPDANGGVTVALVHAGRLLMVGATKLRAPKQPVGPTTPPLVLVKPVMPVTAQRSEPITLPRVAIDPLGRATVTVQPGLPTTARV